MCLFSFLNPFVGTVSSLDFKCVKTTYPLRITFGSGDRRLRQAVPDSDTVPQ